VVFSSEGTRKKTLTITAEEERNAGGGGGRDKTSGRPKENEKQTLRIKGGGRGSLVAGIFKDGEGKRMKGARG